VQVPASLITTAGTVVVEATNPDPTYDGEPNFPTDYNFVIAPSCAYYIDGDPGPSITAFFSPIENDGTSLIPEFADVDTNVQTCAWTAKSSVPWAVILSSYNTDSNDNPINAVGNGGTVLGSGEFALAIAPNTGSASRSGTITLAGLTLNFTQDGGATCGYDLSLGTASFTSTGGSGTVGITTASSCSEFVVSEASWITVPKSSGLLVGSATASYSVAANVGPPRTGAVLIGGAVLTVNQAAPTCYYTLSTTSASLPVAGGTGSIGVTPSSPSCAWTAKSSNSAVLSVTSGATGTGNGTVKYSVPANAAGPQAATITIGDTTGYSIFTETQASDFTCTFALTPTPVSVPSNGTSNFFLVNASFNFCKWTAVSNDPASLAINHNSSGTGTGAVYYTVGQNSGGPRTLTITAGCETFTVQQDGVQASNPAPAITKLQPSGATAGSGAFTLTVNGSGFVNGAVVNFKGNARTTTFVSATQVTAAILASDIASTGTPSVTVTNPTPGGGTSNPLTFTITAANNPVPAITKLQPSTVAANSGAFMLTVTGTGFVSNSVVNFNGNARTTTYVSATQVTAAILASDVSSTGTPSPSLIPRPAEEPRTR